MASKKNPRSVPRKIPFDPLSQFDIPDISSLNGGGDCVDDSDADDELESELQALLSGKDIRVPSRVAEKEPLDVILIEKMAAEYLKDDPVEDEISSVSDEENDLLAELHALTSTAENIRNDDFTKASETAPSETRASTVSAAMLEDRLNLYKQAMEVARQCDDTSRVRRYGRAIKTLENLVQSCKLGHVINENDVPPVVAIPKLPQREHHPTNGETNGLKTSLHDPFPPMEVISAPKPTSSEKMLLDSAEIRLNDVGAEINRPPVPHRTAPCVPDSSMKPASETSMNTLSQLTLRRDQYKLAALKAKRCGNTETALKYVKIAKKFDAVIVAEKDGQPVDLTDMPPTPPGLLFAEKQKISVGPNTIKTSEIQDERLQTSGSSELEAAALAAAKEPVDPDLFKAPPPPTTVLEALQQRLERYCSTRDVAKAEGNNSRARRLQRIVQQYEDAVKSYKAGKSVCFEELPCPPGFGPIPLNNESSAQSVPKQQARPVVPMENVKNAEKTKPQGSIAKETNQLPSSKVISSGKHPKIQRANTSSILDKQLRFLLERQKLFRQAALESKKKGDIQQAKEYLRMSKGFESMIEATRNGLPIDATTIPTPPQLDADFVIVDVAQCSDDKSNCGNTELFANLEKELQKQIEMCNCNKNHFMRLGDVTSASKFEKLAMDTKKDLAFIQHLWRNNEPVPIFHYETRLFSLVQCNTELADNELEVIVERGINLPGKPNELDTYVKIEFAIPPETPQRSKTHTVRDTNNPTFHQSFKFEINRKSRSQIRQFKKQVLKFEVFSKGWFFKGDILLGTVSLKLTDLETKCCIHDSFDLMEGRKASGGKLEVQIKVRDPLLVKQVEEVREKWLVIGS